MLRQSLLLFFGILVFHQVASEVSSISGSVELDELSFHKITSKFDASLIKFDVAFPYGDKHDAFVALSKDASESEELLVGQVNVKDYGEKENDILAKKYGATKENFPVVKLFLKGQKQPISFDDSNGFTADALRSFVREKTGIYLSLPGCVKELDKLAIKFMKRTNERETLIIKAQSIVEGKNASKSSKVYKVIMQKVLEKGDGFINSEYERIKKLLNGKVSEDKKKEMTTRLNILQTFQLALIQNEKEEL